MGFTIILIGFAYIQGEVIIQAITWFGGDLRE